MQQHDLCPGCGRPVTTRYPFMHRAGYSVRAFCLASCFVRWDREQQWRQHQIAIDALDQRGADKRAAMPPGPSANRPMRTNGSPGAAAAQPFDVVS
jgi:hypothetical protein